MFLEEHEIHLHIVAKIPQIDNFVAYTYVE